MGSSSPNVNGEESRENFTNCSIVYKERKIRCSHRQITLVNCYYYLDSMSAELITVVYI